MNDDWPSLEHRLGTSKAVTPGTPADDATIVAAERALGCSFPPSYRRMLLTFGWLEIGSLEVFGLGKNIPHHLDVRAVTVSERTEAHPRLRRDLVAIANDGAGNLYCVHCGDSASGQVVFWNHELPTSQDPEPTAPDLCEWLSDAIDSAETEELEF